MVSSRASCRKHRCLWHSAVAAGRAHRQQWGLLQAVHLEGGCDIRPGSWSGKRLCMLQAGVGCKAGHRRGSPKGSGDRSHACGATAGPSWLDTGSVSVSEGTPGGEAAGVVHGSASCRRCKNVRCCDAADSGEARKHKVAVPAPLGLEGQHLLQHLLQAVRRGGHAQAAMHSVHPHEISQLVCHLNGGLQPGYDSAGACFSRTHLQCPQQVLLLQS